MNFTDVFRSIQETGGASFNMDTGELNPTKGYMVPISKEYEREFEIPATFADFAIVFKAYIADYIDKLLDATGDTFIGFWLHDGKLCMDLSENVLDFEEAYAKGFDREQIAIYDCEKKRDINIVYLYPY